MKKKIVCVGRDVAPSRAFRALKPALEKSGVEVVLFENDGQPLLQSDDEIAASIRGADFVLLGMSSSAKLAEPEILAGMEAKRLGIPFGFYGDIRGCWGRARPGSWGEGLAAHAACYLGVSRDDANAAREVFPKAVLFGSGNPLREKMAFPEITREQSRELIGAAPEQKIILASGTKFGGGNMLMWGTLMEALIQCEHPCQLVLTAHPGDRVPRAVDSENGQLLDLYKELMDFCPESVPVRFFGRDDGVKTSNLVPGTDLVVEFGSSIGIEAAYQGIPVITFAAEVLFRRREIADGSRSLEAVDEGLSLLAGPSPEDLSATINRLLTPEGYRDLRKSQERACPKPAYPGETLDRMSEFVVTMLA